MKFKIFSELAYDVRTETTFIFNIQAAANTSSQVILEESLSLDPAKYKWEEFTSGLRQARFLRVHVQDAGPFTINYSAIVELNLKSIDVRQLHPEIELEKVNDEVIPYLFPSRYCQSDKLYNFAQKEFGHIQNTYDRVTAICNWIYNNISYVSGSTNASSSAFDIITQRQGVCRDFAHLGIAFCRALSIPARYFAGYAYKLKPQDFHACFEAHIGNQWLFFDATRMVPSHGLIKIAHGYDAADTSFASIYGEADARTVMVSCESLTPDVYDAHEKAKTFEGLSYA